MKPKKKKLAILRCKCGAMNELSKVKHGPGFTPVYAELECSESGFKSVYGVK